MNVIKKTSKSWNIPTDKHYLCRVQKKMIIMEKNSNLPSRLKTVDHGHSME